MHTKLTGRWILAASLLIPLTVVSLPNPNHEAVGEAFRQDGSLSGPYFGQVPPGLEPEIFAPGIVSTSGGEGCIIFSADGRRILFRRFGIAQLFLEGRDTPAGWRIFRVPAPFSRLDWYSGDFVLAPDSTSLYFTSARPIDSDSTPLRWSNIWITQWEDGNWSPPTLLPSPIRTADHQAYPSKTTDGVLYYFSHIADTNFIYRSTQTSTGYSDPERLPAPINTGHDEYDPFVAPDGSYLIFCSNKPGGFGGGDFYVSFREPDGSWSEPVNMGDGVNSTANENRPFVTLDGDYFFFTSNRVSSEASLEDLSPGDRPGNGSRDIYWVDAQIIERLRPNG